MRDLVDLDVLVECQSKYTFHDFDNLFEYTSQFTEIFSYQQ